MKLTQDKMETLAKHIYHLMEINSISVKRKSCKSAFSDHKDYADSAMTWVEVYLAKGYAWWEIVEAIQTAIDHWQNCHCFDVQFPTTLYRKRYMIYGADILHILQCKREQNMWPCEEWEIMVKETKDYSEKAMEYLARGVEECELAD